MVVGDDGDIVGKRRRLNNSGEVKEGGGWVRCCVLVVLVGPTYKMEKKIKGQKEWKDQPTLICILMCLACDQ